MPQLMRRHALLLLGGALVIISFAKTPVMARGALHGSVRITPGRVAIGKTVTLVGTHLPAKTYFSLILSVPNTARSPWKQFIPTLAKSSAQGSLRITFKVPVVPLCGPATVFVYATGTAQALKAPLTLTGCKRPSAGAPPAPPAPPKKKKRK
jgi:hypothetical protein